MQTSPETPQSGLVYIKTAHTHRHAHTRARTHTHARTQKYMQTRLRDSEHSRPEAVGEEILAVC